MERGYGSEDGYFGGSVEVHGGGYPKRFARVDDHDPSHTTNCECDECNYARHEQAVLDYVLQSEANYQAGQLYQRTGSYIGDESFSTRTFGYVGKAHTTIRQQQRDYNKSLAAAIFLIESAASTPVRTTKLIPPSSFNSSTASSQVSDQRICYCGLSQTHVHSASVSPQDSRTWSLVKGTFAFKVHSGPTSEPNFTQERYGW